ncbi:glycosyltransferase family 2 protein [Marivita sp. S2033]|uniref:glycosyltransferase family 2 protein n=1 Tax=Marivita sp. S2033 TaxID=3373187 RepID=UPI0039819B55
MTPFSVSVVIVSRNRANWLRRCLLAVSQIDYPLFEIAVVACPAGSRIARAARAPSRITVLEFDRPNISAARNLGIAQSNGEIVAFLDDDAVPEPTWLHHITAPFVETSVAQAGGTTLGRNGISVQHAATRVDLTGRSFPAPLLKPTIQVILPQNTLYPRLHGTNMAIRRNVLADMNGFDPRFAFYLDETDLCLRIAKSGGQTAFVPKAVVHHASGPSTFRTKARTPRTLFEIGASIGVFHQKHTPPAERQAGKDLIFADRRNWLLRHMQSGAIMPDGVARLMSELEHGYRTGITRYPDDRPDLNFVDHRSMEQAPARSKPDLYLTGRPLARRRTDTEARKLVQDGHRVTVFEYSRTAMYHHVMFTEGGYWRHTGGIYGRELRGEPLLQNGTFETRINRTLQRLEGIRSKNALIGKI